MFRSIRRRPGGGRAAVEFYDTNPTVGQNLRFFGLALPNPATMLRQIARLIPMPALVELEQSWAPPEPIMLDEKAERLEHVVMLLLEQKDKGNSQFSEKEVDRAVRAALIGLLILARWLLCCTRRRKKYAHGGHSGFGESAPDADPAAQVAVRYIFTSCVYRCRRVYVCVYTLLFVFKKPY